MVKFKISREEYERLKKHKEAIHSIDVDFFFGFCDSLFEKIDKFETINRLNELTVIPNLKGQLNALKDYIEILKTRLDEVEKNNEN